MLAAVMETAREIASTGSFSSDRLDASQTVPETMA